MRYLTSAHLSEHISQTPEGYLLCLDVPIARTGDQEYLADEVPVESTADGRVVISREADDVFAPETMASFEGKPVTIDHPDEDVTPETWRELACGHAQNVRRGAGVQSDLLLADLLITDKDAIAMVRGGLREISCGYDADYEQETPGRGRQRNIRGNHVALVRQGRCGPRCKIIDTQPQEVPMKRSFTDTLRRLLANPKARRALDEAMAEPATPAGSEKKPAAPAQAQATDEGEDRLAALESKVDELTVLMRQLLEAEKAEAAATDEDPEEATTDVDPEEATADGEAPDGQTVDEDEPDPATKTGDRRKVRDHRTADTRMVDHDTVARAALLYPGLRVMDGDRRCAVQRAALRMGMRDATIGKMVKATLRGSTLDKCDCVTLDAAFVAASELAKTRNNGATADGLRKATVKDFGRAATPADMNAAAAKFWGGKRS